MSVGDLLMKKGMADDSLIEFYLKAQEELIGIIERADASSPFTRYRVAQARAIDRVLIRLGARTRKWTGKQIPALIEAGSKETEEKIKAFGESSFAIEFAGVNETAVRIAAADAALEFGKTMVLLKANAQRAVMDKRKLQEKIVTSIASGSSVARTQKQLIDQLQEQGVTVLRAKNGFGRRFNVEHYTNLLVRTQSMNAYNLGARETMLGMGRRFAKVPVLRPDIDGKDICNDYEDKKYVDLKKDQLPPWHPNCRHTLIPVSFEELKAERPDLYNLALAEFRAVNQ